MQVEESKIGNEEEGDLQERAKKTQKNQFLSWFGANDYVKEKIIGNYAIQVLGFDTKEPKPNQPKINHYKYMKQKAKSTKMRDKKECHKALQEIQD